MPAGVLYPTDIKAKAQAMYLQGIQPSAIAEELGIEKGAVRQWVHRNKWKQSREALQGRVTAAVELRAEEAAADEINRHTSHMARVVRAKIDHLERQIAKTPVALVQQATALKTLDDIARRNLGLGDGSEGPKRNQTFNFNLGSCSLPSKIVDISSELKTEEKTLTITTSDAPE